MRIASSMRAIALVGSVALLAAGTASGTSRAVRATVTVKSTPLGKVLVNQNGRTLYLFEKDRRGKSMCSGSCASFWPPLLSGAKPRAGTAAVKASLLGRIKRSDGRMQVTYRGHPLYTFSLDKRAGQTNGEGLDDFGAHWYAVSPAGTKVVKQTTSSGGGGGYPGGYGP
jgi:predicted lipoprotein with Yx(FWY)xxD motif